MGNEMGNKNTSALKEEDCTSEAEKKFLEDGVNEENQIIPAAKDSDANPKAAGLSYDDASEPGIETLREDSNPSDAKGENQPTVEVKDAMEKAADVITFEVGRDTMQEDGHGDQTNPVAKAADANVKALVPASENTRSSLEHESLEGDSYEDDVTVRNQIYRIDEAEVQEKATGLASDNIESIVGKESMEEDTHQDISIEENQMNAGPEVLHIQEKFTEQTSDNAANTLENDLLERDSYVADVNVGHQINTGTASLVLDCKADELQEDIDANEEQDENDMLFVAKETDIQENASRFTSNDPVNDEECFGYKVEDMTEVTCEDNSPIAGSVEPRSENENYEIFPRPEFGGTEEHEKQKESSSKKNDPIRNDCHLDKESSTKQEEQDTTFSNDAELQESSDMISNHDDYAKIFPEPLVQGIESQKRTDFLDTSLHCQKDKDDVLGNNMEFQEKMLCTDESNGSHGSELVNGLREKSGIIPNSPNVDRKINGALETKVTCITDDLLILLHESAMVEIQPDREDKSRTEPKVENSLGYNLDHCSEVSLNEFKDDVANGNFDEERNNVCAFNAYVHSRGNQVEESEETENRHQLEECVNSHKKDSDEMSKDFVVPEAEAEAEADPLIAESTVVDCIYGDDVNDKKKIVEEMDRKSEASCVTVKSNEEGEISKEFNSNLVTLEQEESLTMHISASPSLLDIYNFQQEKVNQKTFTATITPNSDLKQGNNKFFGALADKRDASNLSVPTLDSVVDEALDKEDSSQQLEAKSAANLRGESYPVISPIANGGCEGMKSITRLSTESNPDISIISSQMQKSPSFNINLRIEARSEESDQIPLPSQEKTTTGNLSNQMNHGNINSTFHPEYDRCMIKNEEVEIEEKVVTMERSHSEKSKAPFLGLLKEEEEAHLLVKPQKQTSNGGGTKKTVKEVASPLAKGVEKRKPKPSFFSSCMCCATVMN